MGPQRFIFEQKGMVRTPAVTKCTVGAQGARNGWQFVFRLELRRFSSDSQCLREFIVEVQDVSANV